MQHNKRPNGQALADHYAAKIAIANANPRSSKKETKIARHI
jgi:hypothetical protein